MFTLIRPNPKHTHLHLHWSPRPPPSFPQSRPEITTKRWPAHRCGSVCEHFTSSGYGVPPVAVADRACALFGMAQCRTHTPSKTASLAESLSMGCVCFAKQMRLPTTPSLHPSIALLHSTWHLYLANIKLHHAIVTARLK